MKVKVTITAEDGELLDTMVVEDSKSAGMSSILPELDVPSTPGGLANWIRDVLEDRPEFYVND